MAVSQVCMCHNKGILLYLSWGLASTLLGTPAYVNWGTRPRKKKRLKYLQKIALHKVVQ